MTTSNLTDLSLSDRAFAEQAAVRLRASESLNYVESARLAAARHQAMALVTERHRMPAWAWLAAPAVLAVVTVSLLRVGPVEQPAAAVQIAAPTADVLIELASDVNAAAPAAFVWASDEAGPDFYRDLEFYQWLHKRSPAEPNA